MDIQLSFHRFPYSSEEALPKFVVFAADADGAGVNFSRWMIQKKAMKRNPFVIFLAF